jgi:hypothetical protein
MGGYHHLLLLLLLLTRWYCSGNCPYLCARVPCLHGHSLSRNAAIPRKLRDAYTHKHVDRGQLPGMLLAFYAFYRCDHQVEHSM